MMLDIREKTDLLFSCGISRDSRKRMQFIIMPKRRLFVLRFLGPFVSVASWRLRNWLFFPLATLRRIKLRMSRQPGKRFRLFLPPKAKTWTSPWRAVSRFSHTSVSRKVPRFNTRAESVHSMLVIHDPINWHPLHRQACGDVTGVLQAVNVCFKRTGQSSCPVHKQKQSVGYA